MIEQLEIHVPTRESANSKNPSVGIFPFQNIYFIKIALRQLYIKQLRGNNY